MILSALQKGQLPMENIDPHLILKLAKLSYLELSEEEKKELVPQLQSILKNFQKINAINTDGVEQWKSPSKGFSKRSEDQVQSNFLSEDLLENAPDRSGNLYKVPLVYNK